MRFRTWLRMFKLLSKWWRLAWVTQFNQKDKRCNICRSIFKCHRDPNRKHILPDLYNLPVFRLPDFFLILHLLRSFPLWHRIRYLWELSWGQPSCFKLQLARAKDIQCLRIHFRNKFHHLCIIKFYNRIQTICSDWWGISSKTCKSCQQNSIQIFLGPFCEGFN